MKTTTNANLYAPVQNRNLNNRVGRYGPGSHSTTMKLLLNGQKNRNGIDLFKDEVNGNLTYVNGSDEKKKFEVPLPFGYHMDLDFLRICSSDSYLSGETLERLKELRKQRRKQRKTLEALMGIRQDQTIAAQSQRKSVSTSCTVRPKPFTSSTPIKKAVGSKPDVVATPEFIKEALRDAVKDFEQCLERTKEDHERKLLNVDLLTSSTPTLKSNQVSRFNTFPRVIPSPGPDDQEFSFGSTSGIAGGSRPGNSVHSTFKLFRPPSNSSISSISTNCSTALPHVMNMSSPDAVLANLPSSVPSKATGEDLETESIVSITSDMSTTTLKNIREQMAKSLQKLKEYERQVETIPVLQVKLSVLKEEKRLLMLKLKQRELELRRERGEDTVDDETGLDYETEDEDAPIIKHQRGPRFQEIATSRARSESPYARGGFINPDEFISTSKIRSASACGYNSDSDLMMPMTERSNFMRPRLAKSNRFHNLSTPHIERSEVSFYTSGPSDGHQKVCISTPEEPKRKVETRNVSVNTDRSPSPPPRPKPPSPPPKPVTRERGVNTDPPPKPPPPVRKISYGVNTTPVRTLNRSTGTSLSMDSVVTKEEMDTKVQEAIFKTEEEIMGCPLLQKAMAKVEEEAIHGPKTSSSSSVDTEDVGCQVGDDNLRPFVISVGLQCKLDDVRPIVYEVDSSSRESLEMKSRVLDLEKEKIVRSVGVGECKVIEDPKEPAKFKDIGVCTEKWVEVIKASKQTDTEDFAYKDTPSPRVADIVFEPSPERVVLERRSSLRRPSGTGSPSLSRKSSMNSPVSSRKSSSMKAITRSQGTMTAPEPVKKTRDANVTASVSTKSVGTSALTLPLQKSSDAASCVGSPLGTPEKDKMTLCDKCDRDIHKVAEGVLMPNSSPLARIQPPSPDMPWVSKIPRPVPENPDVHKLKAASSTDNLSIISNRSRSPIGLQRSKSSLTPTQGRKLISPLLGSGRDVGTPPPHPSTPPVGSRRIPSPLARSQSPFSQEKRSLIPKLSPGTVRKNTSGQSSSTTTSSAKRSSSPAAQQSSSETKSLIPRVVTPPALRKMYPKTSDKLATPDRNVVRKNTFTKLTVGVANPDLEKSFSLSTSKPNELKLAKQKQTDVGSETEAISSGDEKSGDDAKTVSAKVKGFSSTGFPLPGVALFAPIDENRSKVTPSKEMKAALKVLNDSLGKNLRNAQITNAINIVQQEWFKVSSTKKSNPLDVEDYLDAIEDMSKEVLARVVNLTDVNGNTALHYSVSHGNFDVISVLLDSKCANPNILNKAGYTCIMLISLAQIHSETHKAVVSRLFSMGDVNIRATQHGQTALMLAVSHGRLDMVQLLVEAGADVNIRDEDGSTALMCAAEHGHMDIVKYLLQQPETNVLAKDNDGLTALAVAMEAGHRDIGVVLYANMSFSRGASPYSSMRMKNSPTPTNTPKSPLGPTPPLRTRRNSLK